MHPLSHASRFLTVLAALALAAPSATATPPAPRHAVSCVNGVAEGFACSNVDLAAHLSLAQLGATINQGGNDLWGWTDPLAGREYALVGVGNGTAFVDVTDAEVPVVLGLLPTATANSTWRDIKVHANHAFIVSEALGHGMQVFDLTRLRNVATPPVTFTADAHYTGFGRAHNIAINEDSGYAYAIGSLQGATQCAGGLHMIDIALPQSPQFAGCFSADGYTHDTQCVLYAGPDADYSGREICFSSNEDTLTIVDVTNKAAPVQISRTGYAGRRYAHQGWLAPGQRWFLMNDELDEIDFGHNTRTYVWDLQDLDNPLQPFVYTAAVASTDHNLYIRGRYAYLANYKSGLRILDLSGIAAGDISEVAYFDTYPADDTVGFNGAWSSYPFFASGTVLVSDMSRGLFVLRPQLCVEPDVVTGLMAAPAGDNTIALSWLPAGEPEARYDVYRESGGCGVGPGELLVAGVDTAGFVDDQASGLAPYGYRVRTVASAQCRSDFSACVEASTSGVCTEPPAFAGLTKATTPGEAHCAVDLQWKAATPNCDGPLEYQVHRSTDSEFVPSADTLIAEADDMLVLRDLDVQSGQAYHYVVRARDAGNDATDGNLVRRAATPIGPTISGTWANGAEVGEAFPGSSSMRHVAWHTTDAFAHSGARSYFSGTVSSECLALTTPPIDLGDAGNSVLEFHHRYGIEDGFDGARVEISVGGGSWTALLPDGGYPQQITDSGNACAWPPGTSVYAGSALDWAAQSFDLSGYTGPVQLRWVLSTSNIASADGWWVDTISVTPAQVSARCRTVTTWVFGDGFEAASEVKPGR
jgi:choice-of-anchor B domain-containing protein